MIDRVLLIMGIEALLLALNGITIVLVGVALETARGTEFQSVARTGALNLIQKSAFGVVVAWPFVGGVLVWLSHNS